MQICIYAIQICTYTYLHEHEVFNTILPSIHKTVTTQCNALQHTATVLPSCPYPPLLQHNATHCHALQLSCRLARTQHCCNTLQHTATHCTYTAAQCNTLQQSCQLARSHQYNLYTKKQALFAHNPSLLNTQPHPRYIKTQMQHTATHCNTLQHTATISTTYQHTNAPNINTQTHRISTQPVGPTDR